MKEPTLEEAKNTINEWPDIDDFVCHNIQHFMYGGEPNDNSIELAQYWDKCNLILKNHMTKYYIEVKVGESTHRAHHNDRGYVIWLKEVEVNQVSEEDRLKDHNYWTELYNKFDPPPPITEEEIEKHLLESLSITEKHDYLGGLSDYYKGCKDGVKATAKAIIEKLKR